MQYSVSLRNPQGSFWTCPSLVCLLRSSMNWVSLLDMCWSKIFKSFKLKITAVVLRRIAGKYIWESFSMFQKNGLTHCPFVCPGVLLSGVFYKTNNKGIFPKHGRQDVHFWSVKVKNNHTANSRRKPQVYSF